MPLTSAPMFTPSNLACSFSGVFGFSQTITDYDPAAENEIVMAAAPGDLVMHSSLMIHRAGRNRTEKRSRMAVGAIYYGESAKVRPCQPSVGCMRSQWGRGMDWELRQGQRYRTVPWIEDADSAGGFQPQ